MKHLPIHSTFKEGQLEKLLEITFFLFCKKATLKSKAATGDVLWKKAFLKTFAKLRGNCLRPAALLKKETPWEVFSSEFCQIYKNNILTEHLRLTAFEMFRIVVQKHTTPEAQLAVKHVVSLKELLAECTHWIIFKLSLSYSFASENQNIGEFMNSLTHLSFFLKIPPRIKGILKTLFPFTEKS